MRRVETILYYYYSVYQFTSDYFGITYFVSDFYHQGYYEMTPTSALIKPKGRKNELDDKGIFCYYCID